MNPKSISQQAALHALAGDLFQSYDNYAQKQITSNRFRQYELIDWLRPFRDDGILDTEQVGTSAEGRPIHLYRFGNGPKKALLWSQMHGDEPTATMAILDMVRFFSVAPNHPAAKAIRENLTLLMLPMLNPDGAERFQRRTVQMIDMNRDALALVTPEAKILKQVHQHYKPDFAFNLHDQDPRYTVGTTKKVTAIALLAPASDEAKTDTPSRLRAKHLAALFADVMAQFIPGHVAKYDDTFEPRAFGDNVQMWGSSTILVESGGWPNDPEKMFLRKLNFVGLIVSLYAIATGAYEQSDRLSYERLPYNMKLMCDLLIRNAQLSFSSTIPSVRVDIGINYEEELRGGDVVRVGKIVEIGDLSPFIAYRVVDLGGKPVDGSTIGLERALTLPELESLINR
ncbi:MAG TPA: M14 family zinc carboxypeptidase [Bacteroidota bacterium]|nr:M14 family zinc carboxypeptidase [Bacteroidota bacterium]